MQTIILIPSMILTIICLSSCSEKTQTVQWYKEHPEVLQKEFEKCKIKTPAELATDKHCTIIRQAQDQAFHQQQRDAPLPDIKFK